MTEDTSFPASDLVRASADPAPRSSDRPDLGEGLVDTEQRSFSLPDLGEGLADAELLHWSVAVGDTVTLNQVIAEVETAKAAVELPSPHAGRVLALHVAEGETVTVGTPIITFALTPSPRDRAQTPTAPSRDPAQPPTTVGDHAQPSATVEERVPVLVGYGARAGTGSRRNGRPRPAAGPPPAAAAPSRPSAKPLVRKLARDNGIDLSTVRGTGVDGIITRQDVHDHLITASTTLSRPAIPATHSTPTTPSTPSTPPTALSAPATPATANRTPSTPATSSPREERIPIKGVRKATAQAMVRSAFTAPTVTEFITIDVTPTMELLARLRASTYLDGVRLTFLAFVAKAMISALGQQPSLNSSWDEAAQEIVLKRYVNLGIATATPRGLMVPSIKDAHTLDLIGLASALRNLTETARDGRATPADLTGGTISITNVGGFGVDSGTPIINPGEAAILCLGAVREQPWVHEGQLAVRWVTTLSLSFDHRLVDGEQGSLFLADIARALATG